MKFQDSPSLTLLPQRIPRHGEHLQTGQPLLAQPSLHLTILLVDVRVPFVESTEAQVQCLVCQEEAPRNEIGLKLLQLHLRIGGTGVLGRRDEHHFAVQQLHVPMIGFRALGVVVLAVDVHHIARIDLEHFSVYVDGLLRKRYTVGTGEGLAQIEQHRTQVHHETIGVGALALAHQRHELVGPNLGATIEGEQTGFNPFQRFHANHTRTFEQGEEQLSDHLTKFSQIVVNFHFSSRYFIRGLGGGILEELKTLCTRSHLEDVHEQVGRRVGQRLLGRKVRWQWTIAQENAQQGGVEETFILLLAHHVGLADHPTQWQVGEEILKHILSIQVALLTGCRLAWRGEYGENAIIEDVACCWLLLLLCPFLIQLNGTVQVDENLGQLGRGDQYVDVLDVIDEGGTKLVRITELLAEQGINRSHDIVQLELIRGQRVKRRNIIIVGRFQFILLAGRGCR